MNDICSNRHGGNSESVEAFISTPEKERTRIRTEIFQLFKASGMNGLTCDELERICGYSHQTASARVSELKRCGWLIVAGRRRTRTGRFARVLVAREAA